MKKGFILSALTTLSMSFLAGAVAPTPVAHAAGQDIKVWVQFSDETAEGKAWAKVVENFNKKYDGKYQVTTEYIPRSVLVVAMKTRSTRVLPLTPCQMLLL